jgi:hypothetical protein
MLDKTIIAMNGFAAGICLEYLIRVEYLIWPLLILVLSVVSIVLIISTKKI